MHPVTATKFFVAVGAMGLVRVTSWYPKFNGSHFGLPPSEIHRMTGLPPKIVWTMTYSHRPLFFFHRVIFLFLWLLVQFFSPPPYRTCWKLASKLMKTPVDGVIPELVFFPFSSEVMGNKTKSKKNNTKRQSVKLHASRTVSSLEYSRTLV